MVKWTLVAGVLSALATGLGALPVALLPTKSERVRALSSALAAGMMISASVFSLAEKGLQRDALGVILGLLAGTAFFWWIEARLSQNENSRGWSIFVAMFVHSIPEGIAIGVGFATGDYAFGWLMAMAISVHNIPEGVAISLPLRAEGASLWRCFWMSVASSLPQPIMAVPAALAAWAFLPILPFGLGFAGGAMVYLTITELIPDAIEGGGKTLAGWGVMLGLAAMLGITTALEAVGP